LSINWRHYRTFSLEDALKCWCSKPNMNNLWIYASGFEAGGPHTPSNIDPWSIIGDDSSIFVATDRSSCFTRNIVALRMEVLCDDCPASGVGIYNPGFWGMVICHHILLVHITMKWIN
jgi:hypothetical protein